MTEIEVFEVRLNDPQLDEAVLKQIDKEIPYHILFVLTCNGKAQAWIGYKEAAASGSNAPLRSTAIIAPTGCRRMSCILVLMV